MRNTFSIPLALLALAGCSPPTEPPTEPPGDGLSGTWTGDSIIRDVVRHSWIFTLTDEDGMVSGSYEVADDWSGQRISRDVSETTDGSNLNMEVEMLLEGDLLATCDLRLKLDGTDKLEGPLTCEIGGLDAGTGVLTIERGKQ